MWLCVCVYVCAHFIIFYVFFVMTTLSLPVENTHFVHCKISQRFIFSRWACVLCCVFGWRDLSPMMIHIAHFEHAVVIYFRAPSHLWYKKVRLYERSFKEIENNHSETKSESYWNRFVEASMLSTIDKLQQNIGFIGTLGFGLTSDFIF